MAELNEATIKNHDKLTLEEARMLGDEELVGTFTDIANDATSINDFAHLAKEQLKGLIKIMSEKDEAIHNSKMDDFFQDPAVQEAEARVMNYLSFNTSKMITLVNAIEKVSRDNKFALGDYLRVYVGYRQEMDFDSTGGYDPEVDEPKSKH